MESIKHALGKWSWVVGICIAVVLGLVTKAGDDTTVFQASLVILGIIVGIINVTGDEAKDFLLAAVALLIAATFGGQALELSVFGSTLDIILNSLVYFVSPMTVVVAVKAIYSVAKDH